MSKPDGYGKGIPGVPLSALNAIQDQNARQVLRAIVDGWHVRNGASGEGDNRFITRAELKEVQGTVNNLSQGFNSSAGNGGGVAQSGRVMSKGEINRIITELEASVMESLLWKELGTEIKRIKVDVSQNAATIQNEVQQRINGDNAIVQQTNTQFTAINGNLAVLQQQYTTLSNNVSSFAQAINTLQSTVGQNSIALQQEMTTRANADNDIYAKYSVKIDNNGYVSGFGLMSTSNNSTPTSDFIVRSDRFAIGSPSGPGITPTVPFIVLTTPDAKGNQPGVYMRNAMIANAAIGTAQIDDLAVNTLKVAGEAISKVRHLNHFWSARIPTSGEILILDLSYTVPPGVGTTKLIVQVTTPLYSSTFDEVAVGMRLYIDGMQVSDIGVTSDSKSHILATAGAMTVGEGYHYIAIKMYEIAPWNPAAKPLAGVMSVVTHGALR